MSPKLNTGAYCSFGGLNIVRKRLEVDVLPANDAFKLDPVDPHDYIFACMRQRKSIGKCVETFWCHQYLACMRQSK